MSSTAARARIAEMRVIAEQYEDSDLRMIMRNIVMLMELLCDVTDVLEVFDVRLKRLEGPKVAVGKVD